MVITCLLAALCHVPILAQEGDAPPEQEPLVGLALFVTSAPIRAEVVVDGNPVGSTPLVLRGLAEGEHTVEIIRPGFHREEQVTVVEPEAVQSIAVTLRPDTFVTSFSSNVTIVDDQTYSRLESRFVLPSGTYEIDGDGSALSLSPSYPHEAAIVTLQIATPVIAAISLIATLEDIWLQDKDTALPTPATIAGWTATAVGGGILLALYGDRAQYYERTLIEPFQEALTASEAESFFVLAEDALGAANLTSALAGYSRVVAYGGDSEFVPAALYKASQIYRALGKSDLALGGFELLVKSYPVIDYYDAALKTIADIHVDLEQYNRALGALGQMVLFVDPENPPLYSKQDITEYVREIQGLRNQPRNTEPEASTEDEPEPTTEAEAEGGQQ